MSLKNLALLVLTSALALAGCDNGTTTPVKVNPSHPPAQLAFVAGPGDAIAGAAFEPVVRVAVRDASGAAVAASTPVTLALGANPAGATLSGTLTVNSEQGVASFPGLSLDKVGEGFSLIATTAGVEPLSSASFRVLPGEARTLVFDTPPSDARAGESLAPSVRVRLLDALGNTASTSTARVTVALGANAAGATLGGSLAVDAVDGVATFPDLSLDRAGTGYTLTVSAPDLEGATSGEFSISAGAAVQLVFTAQPLSGEAGAELLPRVEVAALDRLGNLATDFQGQIALGLAENPTGDVLMGVHTVDAVSGVARFAGLSLSRAGSGYALAATSPDLTPAVTLVFDIFHAPAARIVFDAQPSGTSADTVLSPEVRVHVEDAFANLATGFGEPLSVALSGGTAGAVLGGTSVVNASEGVATFAGLSVDRRGSGYVLAVSGGGLPPVVSESFDITHGAPARLVFAAQPGTATSGAALAPAVQVAVQDAHGDVATSVSLDVTVALGANPGGATLVGTRTVTTVDGIATFAGLALDKAGTGYTLEASAGSLSVGSNAFDVVPGSAARLAYRVQPRGANAGAVLSPAVEVAVLDAAGNLTSSTQAVTLALGANPGGATLSGTRTVDAVAGVATFASLTLDKVGAGYTLEASASALVGDASAAFDISAAAPHRLTYRVQPSNAPAGAALHPGVVVRIEDAFGNRTDSTASVTVALADNPGSATLTGTLTANAVAGEAAFDALSLDKVGTGYTLSATSPDLVAATSASFDISASAAARLAFSVQPANASAGAAIAPSVEVSLLDAFGNRTDSTASVTLRLGANPGGSVLSGTTTVNAADGRATFPGLSLDKVGSGYTLVASSSTVPESTSAAFDVVAGPAERLVFTAQPTSVVAGAHMSPAVTVTVLDAFGNAATSFADPVTVALGNNPGGSTLAGVLDPTPVAGVATFTGLTLDKVGTGYTFTVSAPGLQGATSVPFNVTVGAAAKLAFIAHPSNVVAGEAIAPAMQVRVEDSFGNPVTSGAVSVVVGMGNNPGGAALTGARVATTSAGVATFSTVVIDKVGSGYTLVATANGLTTATSNAFEVRPGPAARLAFRTQPSQVNAGESITPAVEVVVTDSQGNRVAGSSASVTMGLGNNPGGGTLGGTTLATASDSVARFDALSLTRSGTGYTLVASSPGLASATSAAFTVRPGAAQALAFEAQPSNVAAGTPISPSVRVSVRDSFGNVVTSSSALVTVAMAHNPTGATLAGAVAASAVNGVVTFADLSLDKVGAGYTLTATSSGLGAVTSTGFDVTPGAPARLAFSVQPSDVAAGGAITPAVQVLVQDAMGNLVSSANTSVTVAIGNNPGVGILNGTKTVSAVGGVATFPGLSITKTGEGYTLTASATGLSTGTSAAFNVNPGVATSVSFYRNPPNVVTAGTLITPSVQVGVRDAYNNTVTGSSANITLSFDANPGGSTLGGTLTAAAVNGVASFADLTLNKAANNYRFSATSPGLTRNTSSTFIVSAAEATQLAFTTQPANVVAGVTFASAVKVTVRDAFGNTVTSPAIDVSVALGANPGSATLGGTRVATTSSGMATFSNLTLDKAATGYTLVATSAPLPSATSSAFAVTPASAAKVAFVDQPQETPAGTQMWPFVTVHVQDSFGNTVTTSSAVITLGLDSNPGAESLGGTVSRAAVAGVATFNDLYLFKAAAGYTLSASATGLTSGLSAPFTIRGGSPSRFSIRPPPRRVMLNTVISPAVEVVLEDSFGNVATTPPVNVTIQLWASAGGQLSGTLTVATSQGVASFTDLSIDRLGTYSFRATTPGVDGPLSDLFEVVTSGTKFVYAPPPPGGKIALVHNPGSTDTVVRLDLVAQVDLTGYSVGMNLPVDTHLVWPDGHQLSPGGALPAGQAPVAAFSKLPWDGPLKDVLLTGQSQKAAGEGAVPDDSFIPAGSVFYTVQLSMAPSATTGVVFDGAARGSRFLALLRDKLGNDVVSSDEFAIGRLEVQ
ncbi:hypothetical protein P2318_09465 [Myxococcaceae bacterium GXIMD 01537]